MKSICSIRWIELGASLILACASVGCHRQSEANVEMDKAARTMETTETAPTTGAVPAVPSGSVASASTPAQEMNQAVAAYKAGQVKDAVTRLQQLRATPTLTPQQRITLNDAMAAVMSEISTRAAKGDSQAIQALKQYGKMQNERR
jgi:hypothetical protein